MTSRTQTVCDALGCINVKPDRLTEEDRKWVYVEVQPVADSPSKLHGCCREHAALAVQAWVANPHLGRS